MLLVRLTAITKHCSKHCKVRNFEEKFIFANSVNRHVCHVKKSRLWHDITPFTPFLEGFIFIK